MTKPFDRTFRVAFDRSKRHNDRIIEHGPKGHSYITIARMNTARNGWRSDALLLAAAPQMRAILEMIRAKPRLSLSAGVHLSAAELVAVRDALNLCAGEF